jgi:plastocyanin
MKAIREDETPSNWRRVQIESCSLMMRRRGILLGIAMLSAGVPGLCAQATAGASSPVTAQAPAQIPTMTLSGRVEVTGAAKVHHAVIPGTVVWLTPVTTPAPITALGSEGEAATAAPSAPASPAANLRLVQKNKSFEPHILVVPAGSLVEFPNRDPFFHNVFSLFEGKRFDLGLYEAGTSRMVRFDRPGISYIFCNIHPEMSAVVITLATPIYAIANRDGEVSLAGVPYGHYILHVWSEGMGPENAQPVTREVTIGENTFSLGVIRVPEANGQRMAHKNKYGREYDDPTPNNSAYEQQR